MDNIVVKIEYTKKVLIDLNRNHFKYEIRVPRKIINILLIIYFLVDILAFANGDMDYFTHNIILINIILFIIALMTNTNVIADISTNMFLRTDKVSLGLKTEMTFDNEKVTAVNYMENMALGYNKLYKIMETKEYIYLYLNKQQSLIVAKQNMTETDLDCLRNILKSNVKKYIEYMK